MGLYVIDENRFKLFDFTHLSVGRYSSILYSPETPRVSKDTLRIFRIFPVHIWLLIFVSYLCLIFFNSFKTPKILIKCKLSFDYFGAFLFKSEKDLLIFYFVVI